MCDYSLRSVVSRPAVVGDKLVTTTFNNSNSATRGFAARGEPDVAVFLLPGTELAFENEVECDHPFARLLPEMRFGKTGANLARFRQLATRSHGDALELSSGRMVLVTRLCPGQYATVLQLPASTARRRLHEPKSSRRLPRDRARVECASD